MATSFLDLPRELRDEIYHWAWMGTPVIELGDTNRKWVAWYNCGAPLDTSSLPTAFEEEGQHKTEAKSTKMPQWLLTCKRMYEEGTATFLRGGTVYLDARMDPGRFYRPPRVSKALSPLAFREIHVVPNKVQSRWDTRAYDYARALLSDPSAERNLNVVNIHLTTADAMLFRVDLGYNALCLALLMSSSLPDVKYKITVQGPMREAAYEAFRDLLQMKIERGDSKMEPEYEITMKDDE